MTPIQVGQSASLTKTISDDDVRTFAEISGDRNPLHLDDTYAATTMFGRRIAHGALTSALISAVLGEKLPGLGTIYLSQQTQFRGPVFIGDTITARVEVVAYRPDKQITTVKTDVVNQDGKCVLTGEAVVIAPGG